MRIINRILCVILAVISIFVMDIDTVSEVQAASKGKYFGYDTYADLLEARGLEAGAVKVKVSDKSDVVSGFDDNNNFTYYTYAELAKQGGFVIPSSCVKILMNMAGGVFIGYKSDGTKKIIYRTDGYDMLGFDKNGYDRNKNVYGNENANEDDLISDKDTRTITIGRVVFRHALDVNDDKNYLVICDKKGEQFRVNIVYDTNGHVLNKKHYSVKAIAKNVDKYGHGTYVVTIQTDEFYNNVKLSKSVTVIPQEIPVDVIGESADERYAYNTSFLVSSSYYKKNGIVGIEYKVGPLKGKKEKNNSKSYMVFEAGKFNKNCKMGTVKFSKKNIKSYFNVKKGFHIITYAKMDRTFAYECRCRAYVIVNGKKIYSGWSNCILDPYGIEYRIKA